jgi:hypothetical protein
MDRGRTKNTANAGLVLVALTLFATAGLAQSPEFRYWNNRAAAGWARGGVNASRGNVPGALWNYGRAARDTGRALYFRSNDWERIRRDVVRSPYWDSRRNYFRR